MKYKDILVIPDTQFEPGKSIKHMRWVGALAADYEVDCIVHLGDYFDHLGSSRFDKDKPGKLVDRDIKADYEVGFAAHNELMDGMEGYDCRRVLTRGNHDERPRILAETIPAISGLVEEYEAKFKQLGWEQYPYQHPVRISGVDYCHMFTRTTTGSSTPMSVRSGASSAISQLRATMVSCTAGHKPGFRYDELPTNDGIKQGMIVGSFYPHKMAYCGPQGNGHWQGVVLKHMIKPGEYDFERISLKRLKYMYG